MRSHTVRPMFVVNGSSDMFPPHLRFLLGEIKNLYIYFHYFRRKAQNSLFPNCRTLIGNNSVSIEDKAVIYVCSMGFSDMAERLVS